MDTEQDQKDTARNIQDECNKIVWDQSYLISRGRMAAYDMTPDIDGGYRVNECYCHDVAERATGTSVAATWC